MLGLISNDLYSNNEFGISDTKLNEINERVQSSSVAELLLLKVNLEQEQSELNKDLGGTQSPSENKRINERLAEISAEIQLVEAALIALGVAVVAGLSDDDSRATTPVTPTPDTTGPVITINGANPANAELGSTYVDAGASAIDAVDGSVLVTTSGSVDTSTLGANTIIYSATDSSGNTSSATRTVNVVDTTKPVVTLNGAATVTVVVGGTYTELGASATDLSGNVTVVITGTVDTNTIGVYTVTYTSTDASGNAGPATRTVNVVADDDEGPTEQEQEQEQEQELELEQEQEQGLEQEQELEQEHKILSFYIK